MTAITIVTPWYQSHELALGYQRAVGVRQETDRLIIVDNGDAPDINGAQPVGDRVEITAMGDLSPRFICANLGFSKACNVGLSAVETPAVLFLNNDVRMTSPYWLETIRSALKPGVLVGARLRHDPHTTVDGQSVPYLDGWCVAGFTSDIRDLGGWNEDFEEPAYYGDNELCARAVAAGMELVAVPVGLRHIANYTSRRMDVSGVSQRNRERFQTIVRELRAAV